MILGKKKINFLGIGLVILSIPLFALLFIYYKNEINYSGVLKYKKTEIQYFKLSNSINENNNLIHSENNGSNESNNELLNKDVKLTNINNELPSKSEESQDKDKSEEIKNESEELQDKDKSEEIKNESEESQDKDKSEEIKNESEESQDKDKSEEIKNESEESQDKDKSEEIKNESEESQDKDKSEEIKNESEESQDKDKSEEIKNENEESQDKDKSEELKYIGEKLTNSETPIKGSFDNVYCGIWQEQYTQFHRKMEDSDKKKYLILDAHQCGWGDRLIQIVAGFYVALLSKRSFKIIGVDLEDYFEKPNIDWSLDENELKRLEKNKSIKELYYTDNSNDNYNEGFLYTNFTSNYEDYEALRYRIQNGKIVKIFENIFHKRQLYEMGLRPDTAYGCAYEFLFKPKPNVMKIIDKYYKDMGIKRDFYMSKNTYVANSKTSYLPVDDEPIRIGIQIRTGDSVFNGKESKYCKDNLMNSSNIKQYFDCAESLEYEILEQPYKKSSKSISMQSERNNKKVYWFLITDCKILREEAKKKWPDKIITITDKKLDHLELTKNEESISLTFAEHWLFGEMDYHIVSRASCYGRTASLRRKIFHHIYEVEISQPRYANRCKLLNFNTYEDSSRYWIELK